MPTRGGSPGPPEEEAAGSGAGLQVQSSFGLRGAGRTSAGRCEEQRCASRSRDSAGDDEDRGQRGGAVRVVVQLDAGAIAARAVVHAVLVGIVLLRFCRQTKDGAYGKTDDAETGDAQAENALRSPT